MPSWYDIAEEVNSTPLTPKPVAQPGWDAIAEPIGFEPQEAASPVQTAAPQQQFDEAGFQRAYAETKQESAMRGAKYDPNDPIDKLAKNLVDEGGDVEEWSQIVALKHPDKVQRFKDRWWEMYNAKQFEAGQAKSLQAAGHYGNRLAQDVDVGLRLAGGDIQSVGERLGGSSDKADQINRDMNELNKQAEKDEKNSTLPNWFHRALRGGTRSITTALPSAMVAGPAGAIAAAGLITGNQNITQAKDAGLSGGQAAAYVLGSAAIEMGVASLFQVKGLGGVESKLAAKQVVNAGVYNALKGMGKTAAQELPKDLITEALHASNEQLSRIDPNALDYDNLMQRAADTISQTLMMVGGAEGASRLTGRTQTKPADNTPVQAKAQEWIANNPDKVDAIARLEKTSRKAFEDAGVGKDQKLSGEMREAIYKEVIARTASPDQANVQYETQKKSPPTETERIEALLGITPESIDRANATAKTKSQANAIKEGIRKRADDIIYDVEELQSPNRAYQKENQYAFPATEYQTEPAGMRPAQIEEQAGESYSLGDYASQNRELPSNYWQHSFPATEMSPEEMSKLRRSFDSDQQALNKWYSMNVQSLSRYAKTQDDARPLTHRPLANIQLPAERIKMLEVELGKKASKDEIAKELGVSRERAGELMRHSFPEQYADEKVKAEQFKDEQADLDARRREVDQLVSAMPVADLVQMARSMGIKVSGEINTAELAEAVADKIVIKDESSVKRSADVAAVVKLQNDSKAPVKPSEVAKKLSVDRAEALKLITLSGVKAINPGEMTRQELNSEARSAGIKSPEMKSSKQLVEAIIAEDNKAFMQSVIDEESKRWTPKVNIEMIDKPDSTAVKELPFPAQDSQPIEVSKLSNESKKKQKRKWSGEPISAPKEEAPTQPSTVLNDSPVPKVVADSPVPPVMTDAPAEAKKPWSGKREDGKVANPALTEETKPLAQEVIDEREAPDRRSDEELKADAVAIIADPKKVEKLRNKIVRGSLLKDDETIAAKMVVTAEYEKAIKSGDPQALEQARSLSRKYHDGSGTAGGRAQRARREDLGSIEGRKFALYEALYGDQPTPGEVKAEKIVPEPAAKGSWWKQKLDDVEADALKQLQENKAKRKADEAKGIKRMGSLGGNLDIAEDLHLYIKLGAAKLGKGMTKFADWSADMVKQFGEDIEPELKKVWNASKMLNTSMRKSGEMKNINAEIERIVKEIEEAPHRKEQEKLRKRLLDAGIDVNDIESIAKDEEKMAFVFLAQSTQKAGFLDKVLEYKIAAVLSALATQGRNIAGSAAYGAYHYGLVRPTEIALNMALRRKDAAQLGESQYILKGLFAGNTWNNAWRNAGLTWRLEAPAFDRSVGRSDGVQAYEYKAAIKGKAGRIIRSPMRAMSAVDQFMKTMYYNMEVGAQAYRIAKQEGLNGDDLSVRMAELMNNPQSEAAMRALDTSDRLTFTRKNEMAQLFNAVKRWEPSSVPMIALREVIRHNLMFVNTPLNVYQEAIRLSPAGAYGALVETGKAVRSGKWDGATKRLAEQTLSWAATLAISSMASGPEPLITGGDDEDNPYSIKIGNRWYRYADIDPIGSALGAIVDTLRGYEKGGAEGGALNAAKSVFKQMQEDTMLDGVAKLTKLARDLGNAEGIDSAPVLKWLTGQAASFVPNIYRQTASMTRDSAPQTQLWGDDKLKMAGKRLLEKAHSPSAPTFYDNWGRPVENLLEAKGPLSAAVSMVSKNKEDNATEADKILEAFNYHAQKGDKKYKISKPMPSYKGVDGKTKYMTDEEFETYARDAGQLARDRVDRALKSIKSFDRQNPPEWVVKMIDRIVDESRQTTKNRMFKGR